MIRFILMSGTLLSLLAVAPAASFDVPGTMNFQGFLEDSGGVPVNGSVDITTRIYDAATIGNLVWSEATQTGVPVSNGVFSIILGENTPLSPAVFSGAAFTEFDVNGETLSPRVPLRSVPYAFRAAGANNIAVHQTTIINSGLTISTTYVDVPGLSVSLTPSHPDNPIIITFTGTPSSSSSNAVMFTILNTSEHGDIAITERRNGGSGVDPNSISVRYVTTLPAVAQTVKVRFRSNNGSNIVRLVNGILVVEEYKIN